MHNPLKSIMRWLGEFHTSRLPYGKLMLALAVGCVGAAVFVMFLLPLPWMLGPMVFAMAAALGGAPVALPNAVRAPMLIILGAVVGASATPELVSKAPGWLIPLAGLFAVMAAGTAACYFYFRHVGKFDKATAYYSAVPGGLTEMILLGDANGGNARAIALAHASRVVFVVLVVPFLVQVLSGTVLGARPTTGISIAALPAWSFLWFVGTCVIGGALGFVVKSPTSLFLGPLMVSAFVHGAGWSDFKVPVELSVVAQLIIGLSLGCRFAGTRVRDIGLNLLLSLGACLLLLAVSLLVAFGAHRLFGHGLIALLLAYSPGGVAEMSLVALSLHVEVAFVVVHHLVRLLTVTLVARLIFAGMVRAKSVS